MARPIRPLRTGALLAALGAVACSDSEPPTAPSSGAESGEPGSAPVFSHLSEPPDLGAPVALPIPPDNGVNWGAVGWIPLFEVPERTFVHIVIRGGVTVSDNTQEWCTSTPAEIPLAGTTVGPEGVKGEFRVALRLEVAGGTDSNLHLVRPEEDEEGMALEHVGYLTPGTVHGRRTGGGPSCSEGLPDGSRINRAGYLLGGNQAVEARATHPIEIHASTSSVEEGSEVTFTMSGEFGHTDRRWYWQEGDTTAAPQGLKRSSAQWVCGGDRGDLCTITPDRSGRMYARASIRGRFLTDPTPSEVVRVGAEEAVLALHSVTTGGEGLSFLTRGPEGIVTASAVLTPPGEEDRIEWTLSDDPSDQVSSPPAGKAAPGPEAKWSIPAPGPARWEATRHDTRNGLEVKSLAYQVSASVEANGRTLQSEARIIRQDEIDTVRQEYVDLGRARVPQREEFGTPESAHFRSGELNFGDYSVYLARPELLEGLEGLREMVAMDLMERGIPFSGIFLTSVYRNPTHHEVHVGASSRESQHQYGLAADIRVRSWDGGLSRDAAFRALERPAKLLEACWEPDWQIRRDSGRDVLTHAHVDWRESKCPDSWES